MSAWEAMIHWGAKVRWEAMIRRGVPLLLAGALAGCAGGGGPGGESAQVGPARLRVETFGGFPRVRAPLVDRVALLVDATGSMAGDSGGGPSRVRAARAAAERFVRGLDADVPLDLLVLGGDAGAGCRSLPTRLDADRSALAERIDDLRAAGRGSLAHALDGLTSPDEGGYDRVVAVTALDDGCDGDLCRAAQDLADRGTRLDLVLIGDRPAPACLAEVHGRHRDAAPVPWQRTEPVAFHVESVGSDPAVLVCGEAGGLPVQVTSGAAAVVVELDPPLRVERNFLPGTRWVLQVLDFPGLDPQERQWRWQPGETSPPAGAGEVP